MIKNVCLSLVIVLALSSLAHADRRNSVRQREWLFHSGGSALCVHYGTKIMMKKFKQNRKAASVEALFGCTFLGFAKEYADKRRDNRDLRMNAVGAAFGFMTIHFH